MPLSWPNICSLEIPNLIVLSTKILFLLLYLCIKKHTNKKNFKPNFLYLTPCLTICVPVSYTHLDVYKRQALSTALHKSTACCFWIRWHRYAILSKLISFVIYGGCWTRVQTFFFVLKQCKVERIDTVSLWNSII